MHIYFALVRFYPFWALPLAFVLFELGLYYRRRMSPMQFVCFGSTSFFALTGLLWLIFRGDLNSDAWVRAFLGH